MRVLLDTHALLWSVADSPRTSGAARAVIADATTSKLVSIASLWEIAVKVRTGKLEIGMEFDELVALIERSRLAIFLPITPAHVMRLQRLELRDHRDPFDRMLAAQALSEDLTLVSNDEAFDAYGVRQLW